MFILPRSLVVFSVYWYSANFFGGIQMDMWLVFYWTGPIGIGIFLVCLGAMIFLLVKADEVGKRTKAMMKEKGLDKK
jgi:hypothetical protein